MRRISAQFCPKRHSANYENHLHSIPHPPSPLSMLTVPSTQDVELCTREGICKRARALLSTSRAADTGRGEAVFCFTMAISAMAPGTPNRGVVAELTLAKSGQSAPLTAISLSSDQRLAVVGGHGIMKVCFIHRQSDRMCAVMIRVRISCR